MHALVSQKQAVSKQLKFHEYGVSCISESFKIYIFFLIIVFLLKMSEKLKKILFRLWNNSGQQPFNYQLW